VRRSEVSSLLLFGFNGLEEGLEIASSETLMVPSLDDFEEESRSVLDRLSEDLEQVALVVVVDEDLLLLQNVDVFLHLDIDALQFNAKVVVVGVRDLVQEQHASVLHSLNSVDDGLGAHGDVLDTGAPVVLTEFLNLTLALAVGRLIDGHLDLLIEVSHDDGSERTVVRVDHLVIDGPEAMEVEHLFVPAGDGLHLTIRLVTDTMIDVEEFGHGDQAVEDLSLRMVFEAWQEDAIVRFGSILVYALDKRVDSVTVGLDAGDDNFTVLVLESLWLTYTRGTSLDRFMVDSGSIIDGKGDIFDTITVLGVVRRELLMVGVQR